MAPKFVWELQRDHSWRRRVWQAIRKTARAGGATSQGDSLGESAFCRVSRRSWRRDWCSSSRHGRRCKDRFERVSPVKPPVSSLMPVMGAAHVQIREHHSVEWGCRSCRTGGTLRKTIQFAARSHQHAEAPLGGAQVRVKIRCCYDLTGQTCVRSGGAQEDGEKHRWLANHLMDWLFDLVQAKIQRGFFA